MNSPNYFRRIVLAAAAQIFLAVSSLPAIAAEAEIDGLEEIIVTAQKVEQNLRDVPLSVSVLSGSSIENEGANNIYDVNGMAPNVLMQGMAFIPNTANLSIRGIGFFDTDPFADQKTQVLIDGVPHARITGLAQDQIDIERIEILRGPQGTLFGRNSLAGSINIITRDASPEAGVSVRATAGEYGLGKYVLSAETGQMMNNSLRARLTLSSRQYDGHVTNAFSGNRLGVQDSETLRLKIDHNAANVQSTLTFYRVDDEMDGIATTNLTQDPGGVADGDLHLINQDNDGFNDVFEEGFTLRSDIELDAGTISIVANAHDSEFLMYTDLDARAGNMPPAPGRNPNLLINIGFDIDQSQDSLELRFHDSHSERWDYVLGVFAFREKSERLFLQNIGRPFSPTIAYEDAALITIGRIRTNSIAAFAQTDFHVNDRLALIAGARLTQDEKDAFVGNYGLPPPAPQFPPNILEDVTTWDQPTWKLGARFDSSESVMWYATASTGYKAGSYISRATLPENVGPYDAEHVTNYEAGVKANLLDNRLRLSAAAFAADYADVVGWVQRTNSTGRGNEPVLENLGSLDIVGLEFESSWLAAPNLRVDFGFGLLDAGWGDFSADLNNDGVVTDNSDLDVFMAPDLTAYGALLYTGEFAGNTLEYRLDARYQSRYNSWGASNDDLYYRPGTTMLNGSVAWVWGEEGNRITLFARNLGDKEAARMNYGTTLFPYVAIYEPPRLLGVELQLNF